MKKRLALSSFRLLNFKAVQDSKSIKFTPVTAFIGNNGSGKSSIIEALEIFYTLAIKGIDEAMQPWHGFEHIWNRTDRLVYELYAFTEEEIKNAEGEN